ncbi:MAG: EF-hand domain-containing protein [Candidatus Poseidoniaceae archaeon]|nr:EF-hand domain-containing protein [Candidatus Poseidoniaceae archaeon]
MAYWHSLAIFSILAGIFLLFLAYLILKANPSKAKNRFMALMLVSEALRCFTSMLFWVYAWPEEMLNILKPARVIYYTMSLQLFFLYMAAATFYSNKKWAKQISESFRLHSLYLLPIFCLSVVLIVSYFAGGTSVAIGDVSWVYCEGVGSGEGKTASGKPLGFDVTCTKEYESVYPLTMSNVALGPLTRILLFIPLVGAIVATVALTSSRKRINEEGNSDLYGEVRAVRVGFIGKTAMQITTTLILVWMILTLGESPSLQTNVFNPDLQSSNLNLLLFLPPLMPTAVVLAALFEGIVFTYAVIKNDMFGIDEQLRKTFTTTIFAGSGAILFLVSTELMESLFDQGWIGGVFIGMTFLLMRKPIISTLGNVSSKLIPESHTKEELGYLEMYYLAKKDQKITDKERSMLDLQARSYGLTEERKAYLEKWYEEILEKAGDNNSLAKKYGKSGINMMSVFGTTGEAPIDEREIKEAFTLMDKNRDNVISSDEFSEAPEVSKLPEESRTELFNEIDLNKDGVIQYDEFRIQAQVTESEVLNISKEEAYLEMYKVAMNDLIITDDERKMLEIQAKTLGISEQRVIELEREYDSSLEKTN